MSDRALYTARPAECRAEAAAATLDNVRERALRAEAAWRTMAARQERMAENRAVAEAHRQERLAAEAERAAQMQSL